AEFLMYGEKLISLIKSKGAKPLIFDPWTYDSTHEWLQANFKCYRENPNHSIWFGNSLADIRKNIDEGIDELAAKTGAEILPIGQEWWRVRMNHDPQCPVRISQLYNSEDHKHPTML